MSWRVGPLALAVASAAVRLTGDHGSADLFALAYLGAITLHLQRKCELRPDARPVRPDTISAPTPAITL